MNSFYIVGHGTLGECVKLEKEDAVHAFKVLRLQKDEAIYAVDEARQRFEAQIVSINKDECIARLTNALPSNEAPIKLTIYQGLPKADKLDMIVQKLTELGATAVVPTKMERCVVKLDSKDGAKRAERLVRIAREASKQCKRACAPDIIVPNSLDALIPCMKEHDLLLVPWEDASGYGMLAAHDDMPDAKDIGIIIGPEGGISASEIAKLNSIGAKTVTLGKRILRTETAAVTACALAMLLWGDLG